MFVLEMKKLLKYIFISILALAFFSSVKDYPSSGGSVLSEIKAELVLEQDTFVSSSRTGFCPPRQTSTLSIPRVQNSSRHESSNRQNSEFVKSGKTITSGVNYIARNKTLIQYSPHVDPGHKLVSLCRFII